MGLNISVSYDNDAVVNLLTERLYDPNFGEYQQGMPPKVFGLIHREGETATFLFLRFVGFKSSSDNGYAAYLIRVDSKEEAIATADEASKIYLSVKDNMDYHKHLKTSALHPTSSWYPHLSGYEWDLLEDRGYVAGLSCDHWYEVFLSFNETRSLERLAKFYHHPVERAERLVKIVTDNRVLDYFSSRPDQLLSATARQFEQLVAELLAKLGYKNIKLSPEGKDGGVDITAFVEHPLAVERLIVQCKRYRPPHKVGEPIIKQLLTDVDIRGAARGLIVTTTTLTKPARLFIESFRHRLSHIDGDELRKRLIQFRNEDTS